MKKVLIVGIFIFMTKWNFMLSWAKHEKSFYGLRQPFHPIPVWVYAEHTDAGLDYFTTQPPVSLKVYYDLKHVNIKIQN